MEKRIHISHIVYTLLLTILANSYILLVHNWGLLLLFVPAFLLMNAFAGIFILKTKHKRLKICYHGAVLLLAFEISTFLCVIFHIFLAFRTIPDDPMSFLWSALVCIIIEALVFWNGIACIYLTSVQLGIKHRVIGILCGMIPIANLIVLNSLIRTVLKEVRFECTKERLNLERKDQQICKTKYPILLVHGVFFRDTLYFNYWGRIPKELEQNGACVYYGNHQSAASIADSADELTHRIKVLVKKLGCEKVNIIAHSKGGLDCRYAIAKLDAAPYVASLTTINTPHRGCIFADQLLDKIPADFQNKVADKYNAALKKLGDFDPDFLAAVTDLTASSCEAFNQSISMPEGLYCQSVGSLLKKARGGKFPMNVSYHLVKYYDGPNDGLVSENSFAWGEKYTLLTPKQTRGISHGDMIDLNRQNIEGFDVREFYVDLVSDLKNRGF